MTIKHSTIKLIVTLSMCKAVYSLTDILLLESLIVVRESYFYLIYVTIYSFLAFTVKFNRFAYY